VSLPAVLRDGRDDDAAGFIALISACWAEYPGCVFDLDGEVPELRALASHYAGRDGALFVADADDGGIAGMVGIAPASEDGVWNIGKMYVERARRGTALAAALLARAETYAARRGARRLELWSDTRFTRAHRFYEKYSYVRSGPIRALGDKSNTIEFHFAKPIDGIERLGAAAAESAVARLSALLTACVDGGASVSLLPPLVESDAAAFWRRVAKSVAAGTCILFAAWRAGALVGTVQLDLDTPPNQPHRVEVRKLLVAPDMRRRGVGRALMDAAEAAAHDAGRTLMTLDTLAGDAAETLYRATGWTETGQIPGCVLDVDGAPRAMTIFWKRTDGAS
jgi:GNAT superfamily N-acetyltransferase